MVRSPIRGWRRPTLRLTLLSVTSLMLASAAAGPSALAAYPQPGDPLPACDYQDVRTRYTAYDDWRKTLLDTIERVSRYYVPPDLVSTSEAHIAGSGQVRAVMVSDLRAMASAARGAGKAIAVRSAYRSYAEQKAVFAYWVASVGYQKALLGSARPGHSEHQLGLAVDFRSASSTRAPWDYADWAATPPGAWMKQHAWQYGFIMSYPKGKTSVTCYMYEPWHYRYVGRPEAAAVHDSGMVLRRYLWQNFETAPSGA
jgi:D-alanyl-D-alanine carboxypeptidase